MGDLIHATWVDTDDTGFQAVCSTCDWCGQWHRISDDVEVDSYCIDDAFDLAYDEAAEHGRITEWFRT